MWLSFQSWTDSPSFLTVLDLFSLLWLNAWWKQLWEGRVSCASQPTGYVLPLSEKSCQKRGGSSHGTPQAGQTNAAAACLRVGLPCSSLEQWIVIWKPKFLVSCSEMLNDLSWSYQYSIQRVGFVLIKPSLSGWIRTTLQCIGLRFSIAIHIHPKVTCVSRFLPYRPQ